MHGADDCVDYDGSNGVGGDKQHRLVLDELLQELDQVLV